MRQLVTDAIILQRTDYGEADRILTLLTPDYGKLSLLAKGVRRIKSKLAGGIELFSVSQITFIKGRGEVGTLVSTRLKIHYGTIVKDLARTMAGYELIKQLNKATEEQTDAEYFELLRDIFEALDDAQLPLELVRFWFAVRLLQLNGHTPNLQTDTMGTKLSRESTYHFDFEHMAFAPAHAAEAGRFNADHIKFLRLAFAGNKPRVLGQVRGSVELIEQVSPLISTMLGMFLRV